MQQKSPSPSLTPTPPSTSTPAPQSFLSKIGSHSNFKHFILYSLSYLLFGIILTCLGPMFPYLAEVESRVETEYSFLFTCRAIGFICGSITIKYIGKKLYLHQIIAIGIALTAIFSILFNTSQNLYIKGLYSMFSSYGSSFQDVTINLAAVECFKGENMAMWLQLIHGALGIGGLLGPLVVYLFQLNTLVVMGIVLLCTIGLYFMLETPEKLVNITKLEQQDYKIQDLPPLSLYLISAGFLLSVGQQTAYGGWVSSYAVLYDFSTKQHATFYSSLYWISITFFRFVIAMISGSASRKIVWLGYIGIVATAISYFLIFNINPEFGLISMSILYGLCNSVLFPLLLTIPQQFGYKLSIHASTTFLIWASIGDGCIGVVVGKMMGWFSYNWLLYSIGLMNVALVVVMRANQGVLIREQEREREREGMGGKLERLIGEIGGKKEEHFYLHKVEDVELKQVKK